MRSLSLLHFNETYNRMRSANKHDCLYIKVKSEREKSYTSGFQMYGAAKRKLKHFLIEHKNVVVVSIVVVIIASHHQDCNQQQTKRKMN